ncbi:glucose-1-phosphate cytidylyltransferase [Candidatus Curtissbacteria bacterium]|nr:glucose-1-phosphate cytidylyltransferase [Candidatus Curtissbacteria bacterium]
MKTVILCGGIGYRLKEETEFKPKPMIEIGGKPILWHIMKIYSHWGFNDFIIALGYKGNIIKDYFVNKKYYDGDFRLNTANNKIIHYRRSENEKFKITFVDTGLESLTGERLRRVQKYIDTDQFMLTYGDGLADINIKKLLSFHTAKRAVATFTGVYPTLKYGGASADREGYVKSFEKKAQIKQSINGGFMVFNKSIFKYLKPNTMIEDVFDPLISKKQVSLFEHPGFFHAMDTYNDVSDLNEMWSANPAWKIWA